MLNFPLWWWLAPCGAVSALAFAFLLYRQMLAAAPGDDQMQKVAGFVREGAFAFLTGGILSGLAAFIGMNTATRASNRTAQATKESLNRGLQVAFRAGAVMGLVVVGLGLLHITLWFWLLAWLLPRLIDGFAMSLEEITLVMLCFGIGASVMALFARVGGGIFTCGSGYRLVQRILHVGRVRANPMDCGPMPYRGRDHGERRGHGRSRFDGQQSW